MFFGEARDFEGVGKGTGEGLVDEHRQAGLEHGLHLFQVRAPVDAFQHDGVDQGAEFLDGIDDLDAIRVAKLLRVLVHPGIARLDVVAAALERGDDPGAGDVFR